MITANDCLQKWGNPTANESKFMVMWDVPSALEIGVIPKRIYCNKIMVTHLSDAFHNLITKGLIKDLKTWDGCFNIRKKRGATTMSLHSWGIAVDLNAAWNQFGHPPNLSAGFVACFEQAGFDWGGYWKKPDGMHFQLREI